MTTLNLLPSDDTAAPSTWDRIRFFFLVVAPWVALYEITAHMDMPGHAFALKFERDLPIYPWTAVIYESTYVAVATAPWCARTRHDLRQLMISAWLASAVVFPIYWLLPSNAPRRPLTDAGWSAHILTAERRTYPPVAAFPSFHVLWAVFVARLYRPMWLGATYVAGVAITCVSTGMHYIPDVLAALAIAPLLIYPQRVWAHLLRLWERQQAARSDTPK